MIALNNKKIGFIIDSSSNIKDGQYDDVKVIPLGVSVQSGNSVSTYKDGIDFSNDDLKLNLSLDNVNVKTSQAAMPDMFAAAEAMCSKYDQVFVFPIHKNLSGNYNSWNMVKDDYPNLNVVMTCDIGQSFAWTIDEVKEFLKNNEATEQNVQKFVDEQIIPNRIGFLMVEDLTQLVKGGRVSGFKAALAKVFKVKPIILFSKDGLTSINKAKDYEGLFEKADDYIKEHFEDKQPKRAILFVPYNDDGKALEFKIQYQNHYGTLPHESANFPTVVVSHTGLSHVAIYFELE